MWGIFSTLRVVFASEQQKVPVTKTLPPHPFREELE